MYRLACRCLPATSDCHYSPPPCLDRQFVNQFGARHVHVYIYVANISCSNVIYFAKSACSAKSGHGHAAPRIDWQTADPGRVRDCNGNQRLPAGTGMLADTYIMFCNMIHMYMFDNRTCI